MGKLLDEYKARFGEQFPLMLCLGLGDDRICNVIQECLDKDTPYTPKLNSETDY